MSDNQACLLIDNSNTRTKFMLCGCGAPELRILPTSGINRNSLEKITSGWTYGRACFCSVVPWAAAVISDFLEGTDLVCLNAGNAHGVDFSAYPGATTLGADRVANVLAAVHYAPLPLVAVDLGTATTLDVVVQGSGGPAFSGGVIAPGLLAVADSLHLRTAQLPAVDLSAVGPVIGRNTGEAMAAALRVGYPGMVDALLDAIEAELGEAVNVVLTGGDAQTVAPLLRHRGRCVPALTLEGLAKAIDVQI